MNKHNERAELIRELKELAEALPFEGGNAMDYAAKLVTKAAAMLEAQPAEQEKGRVVATTDFIRRTNDEYAAWCKTHYQSDALDERGMASLHGLWAWQEQERRKCTTPPAQPAREWVSLTDEEKAGFWKADQMTDEEWNELFSNVELLCREKNARLHDAVSGDIPAILKKQAS